MSPCAITWQNSRVLGAWDGTEGHGGQEHGTGRRVTRAGDTGWDGTEGHTGRGHGMGRDGGARGPGTRDGPEEHAGPGTRTGTGRRGTRAGDTGRDGGAHGPGTQDTTEEQAAEEHAGPGTRTGTGRRGTRAGDTGRDGGAHGPGTQDTTEEQAATGGDSALAWCPSAEPAEDASRASGGRAGLRGRAGPAVRGRGQAAAQAPSSPGSCTRGHVPTRAGTSPRGGAGRRPLALTAASGLALGPRPGGAPGPGGPAGVRGTPRWASPGLGGPVPWKLPTGGRPRQRSVEADPGFSFPTNRFTCRPQPGRGVCGHGLPDSVPASTTPA